MVLRSRRAMLYNVCIISVLSSAGCIENIFNSSSDGVNGSRVIRRIEPVRTEGEPIERPLSTTVEGAITTALGDQLDCSINDLPTHDYENGLVIETTTTIRSVEKSDVAFPSPTYRLLKRTTPRSVTVPSSTDNSRGRDSKPIFIRAILRKGSTERVDPELGEDCKRSLD